MESWYMRVGARIYSDAGLAIEPGLSRALMQSVVVVVMVVGGAPIYKMW